MGIQKKDESRDKHQNENKHTNKSKDKNINKSKDKNVNKALVVGAGLAGATAARILAERDYVVEVIDKETHIGGNCFDKVDEHGIMAHVYGPHIFHTDYDDVYDFLSRFTEFRPFTHKVTALIDGQNVPIPFNLRSIEMCFNESIAETYKSKLIERFGFGATISIFELNECGDPDLAALREYIYENVFRKYSMKQWGGAFAFINQDVLKRVPVRVSYDDRYFSDSHEAMPGKGYTEMFRRMLDHPLITLRLGVNAKDILSFNENGIELRGEQYVQPIIYTGAIDELFDCDLGALPYRTLSFEWRHLDQERYQPTCVVNHTTTDEFTRISEYKFMTGYESASGTTICMEYPKDYVRGGDERAYYPVFNDGSAALYEKYAARVKKWQNFIPLGRLAEYKYYDMDDVVARAMKVVN